MQARVLSNNRFIASAFLMWLEAPEIARACQPGQFVMVKCGQHTTLRRPLAIHQVDANGQNLALLYAVVGRGTAWLSSLKTGHTVNLLGPLGNSFTLLPNTKNVLMVTGGLGIAPLRFLADYALGQGKAVIMLQGAASAPNVYPLSYLPAGLICQVATEDGSMGKQCMVTTILSDNLIWADQLVACGPVGMYHPVASQNNLLPQRKPYQVSLETRMGCGFGACYGCSIKTRQGMQKICQDGPVFDYYDIMWEASRPG